MMAEVTLHKAEKYAFNMRRLSEDDRMLKLISEI